MILGTSKKGQPLHAPRYRADAFQPLKASPQLQAVVARCSTSKPKQEGSR
jgi:hypothetical protein